MVLRNSVFSIVWCIMIFCTATLTEAVDKCPPSFNPPGGLAVNVCPQFVVFGWDDNNFSGGINWILDFMKGKTNPNGSRVRATFFIKGKIESNDDPEKVVASWKRAYNEGYEIGNHTFQHIASDIDNELRLCDSVLQSIGIPKDKVIGFRTPQLAVVPSVFDAIFGTRSFTYDCTVEHCMEIGGDKFVWPYTLEGGMPTTAMGGVQKAFPGKWEMPVHFFSNGNTGFDYNAWVSGTSGSAFLKMLKDSFDHHMKTNRTPLFIGVHTDYYDSLNTQYPVAKVIERRKAIEDMILYALQHKEARVVAMEDVLKWMRNPVPFDQTALLPTTKVPTFVSIQQLTTRSLVVTVQREGLYTIEIVSLSGKRVVSRPYYLSAGRASAIPFEKDQFSTGMYIVRIASSDLAVHRSLFLP
ncbi:MAG: hypothetical protein JW795_13535 [Chitinivibrionales bacterium]|nr:hypothetical protein [Chitinivibrionales bacterium]